MDEPPTGEIEFTARWWREKLPGGTYQVSYAIDGEPAVPSGWPKRSRSWVWAKPALWGSAQTTTVATGPHTVHAWMTVYRGRGLISVDFRYRCRLEVEVATGLVRHVTYAIHRVPGPPFMRKLGARLSVE